MSDIEIRPYRQEDSEALVQLMAQFMDEVDFKGCHSKPSIEFLVEESQDALQEMRSSKDDWCILAVDAGEAVGYSKYHLYNNGADKAVRRGDIMIEETYVHPDHRGKGVGPEFHEYRFRQVDDLKADIPFLQRLISCIEDTNHGAIKMAKKMGFKRIPQGAYSDNGLAYHYYAKRI